jgi:hypothetical protein
MNQIAWDSRKATRHLTEACLIVAGVWAFSSTLAIACVFDIRGEAVTIEQAAQSTSSGAEIAMDRLGGGWFQAAEIVKEGGSTEETYVTLALDGQEMITTSFASLENPWMQLDNAYMVANVRTQGNTRTMTIWYTPELRFMFLVSLHVDVHEEGVDSVRMRAVMNKAIHIAPLPGTPTADAALPAFK